jgi:chitodextrinase
MLGIAPALAAPPGRDRQPPTTPTNLRVTATTPYSVTLAWNPSTDNSGSFNYVICCANTSSATVPGGGSSYVFTSGLEAGRSYSLRIYAVDAAGNASRYSNTVSFTLPADTQPPSQPSVSVTGTGPTHIVLAWSAVENGPNVWFTVYMDGGAVLVSTRDTSATIGGLTPAASHTFTVRASDFAGNQSPLSNPVTASTTAANPNDHTGPTSPANLRTNGMAFSDGETWLWWDASVDDNTPANLIEYHVYVNGVFDHKLVGATRTILYGNPGAQNTISIIAVDSAGNASAPATLIVNNT